MNSNKPVIGLVGGIGSGKSAVAKALARRGGVVIDADAIGHQVLEDPAIEERARELWGERILDNAGNVDRKKLGAIVFASPVERAKLEHVVHPWIGERIRGEIARRQADPAVRFVVLDAAVMLEAGWNNVCDRLVYIHAPRVVRLARIAEQRHWTETELMAREVAQLSLSIKAMRADAAIDNGGSLPAVQEQTDRMLREWGLIDI